FSRDWSSDVCSSDLPAIGLGLDHAGTLAAAGALDHPGDGAKDRDRVVAVDDDGGHGVAGGADADVVDRRLDGGGNGQAVFVVLEHEDDGQLPQPGHVHRLVADAGLRRAVAEDAHGDVVVAEDLVGQRHAGGGGDAGADDGVAADHALAGVGDQHVAGPAAAIAG